MGGGVVHIGDEEPDMLMAVDDAANYRIERLKFSAKQRFAPVMIFEAAQTTSVIGNRF
jgi:hypothetical protein